MALNLGTSGGKYTPYTKYNAKAGRWYIKGENGEIEVQPKTFVADFAKIKTGWMLFLEGRAPNQVWDIDLTAQAPKPSDAHKRGFSLKLFSKASFNGVVELASSSMHLCNAVNDLYSQYEEASAKPENAGKVAVVEFVGSTPMKDKLGTNYKPEFKLVKFVDRPAELDAVADDGEDIPVAVAKPKPAAPVAATSSEF